MGSSKDVEQGKPAEGVPAYYGTFQDQASYPQPVPPSEAPHYAANDRDRNYYYQSVQGVHGRIREGRPLLGGEHFQRGEQLPFCNLGFGWFLFILGFIFVIPWYLGAVIFFCLAHDYRERNGLMACIIAGIVFLLAGGTKATGRW